jgi:hypothetical protein
VGLTACGARDVSSVTGAAGRGGAPALLAYETTLAELLGPNGPKAEGEPALACYVTGDCPK